MAEDFLPEDYEVPQTGGNYMKFKEGANRFRILSRPVIGFETWEDKVVTRYRMKDPKCPKDAKHFWALVVYNYDDEAIQVLTITQKGIMNSLTSLAKDPDWGTPMNYDIVVTRSGKNLDTEYTVNPKPAKELDSGIVKAYQDMKINLDALFTNEDPFNGSDIVEAAASELG
jgi:hypothetical protein